MSERLPLEWSGPEHKIGGLSLSRILPQTKPEPLAHSNNSSIPQYLSIPFHCPQEGVEYEYAYNDTGQLVRRIKPKAQTPEEVAAAAAALARLKAEAAARGKSNVWRLFFAVSFVFGFHLRQC